MQSSNIYNLVHITLSIRMLTSLLLAFVSIHRCRYVSLLLLLLLLRRVGRETGAVHLRIDLEKDGRDNKDTNGGRGCFFVPLLLLVVVVVARVLHFVVNLLCDKMVCEGRSGGVKMKAVSDDLTSSGRAFGCVEFIKMSRNKNKNRTKKRSG